MNSSPQSAKRKKICNAIFLCAFAFAVSTSSAVLSPQSPKRLRASIPTERSGFTANTPTEFFGFERH